MENPRTEFMSWLALNASTFKKYDINEIAHFAKLNDFDMGMVFDILPHWMNERERHSSYRIREAWYVDRELGCMNPLTESWEHLGRYLTDGYEFHA